MIHNDDKQIWKIFSERANPDADTYGHDAEDNVLGAVAEANPDIGFDEDDEGCPNLERLINGEEDAEGREEISLDDEAKAFPEIEEKTPL
tara:strand:+ start:585 stop:854 length:270 start_codon:yes stop_codon:yes gene_type:complete